MKPSKKQERNKFPKPTYWLKDWQVIYNRKRFLLYVFFETFRSSPSSWSWFARSGLLKNNFLISNFSSIFLASQGFQYVSGSSATVTGFHRWIKVFEVNFFMRKTFFLMLKSGRQNLAHSWSIWPWMNVLKLKSIKIDVYFIDKVKTWIRILWCLLEL